MWGLFSMLESCQGRGATHKLISNGRPPTVNKPVFDNSRKLDQLASFDEECRKIKNEAQVARVIVDSSARNRGNRTRQYMSTKQANRVLKGHHQQTKTDSELFDHLTKTHKRVKPLFCKEGTTSEPQSFSNALHVLNSDKDLWQKMDYNQCEYSSKAKKPWDKIVLKPAQRNVRYSENVTCYCSSMPSQRRSSRRALDAKIAASFSFREMKKRLKHTFQGTRKAPNRFSDKLSQKRSTETVRKKLDISSSSIGFSKKRDFDVILEAKRHLSARLKCANDVENPRSKRPPRTLGRILSSPDHDFWALSPSTSPSVHENGRQRACLSPLRTKKEEEVDYDKTRTCLIQSTNEEGCDPDFSETDNMKKSDGEFKIVEINNSDITRTETMELHKEDENDSVLKNETCISPDPVDDFPSTPSSTYQLDSSNKHQEEHRSPVSVLEPFSIEDAYSPPSTTLPTGTFLAGQSLQPMRLDFEECSSESLPHDPTISTNSFIEDDRDYISHYVHLIFQASCLNWDNLSEISPPTGELLHASLFDEFVKFLPTDCYFDPKLLFDHMNEVLLQIYQSNCCLPPWLVFAKPRIKSVPLEELVLDEIMNEAEFYLLPRTEKRTLDQLVSKDVADCGSWIDVRLDTEEIVIDLSEDLLEESILHVLLELHI